MGLRWFSAAVVATATLLLVACGGTAGTPAPPASTVETAPASTATPSVSEPTPVPTVRPDPTATLAPSPTLTPVPERATSYADMGFTVLAVVETNETWRTYGGPETQESDDSFLYVHLRVVNKLEQVDLQLSSDLFFLQAGSVPIEALRLRSQPANVLLALGEAVEYITGFQLPDGFDIDAAVLVITEPGRIPASLKLTGLPVAYAYPIEATVEDEGSPVSAGIRCDDLTVDPVRALVDLDAGVDEPGTGSRVADGRRVREGERFLRFEVVASTRASRCGVRDDYFRLEVDGRDLEPVHHIGSRLEPGQKLEFELVFRVPVTAEQIVLHAGEPGGNVKPFPITVSDFGP